MQIWLILILRKPARSDPTRPVTTISVSYRCRQLIVWRLIDIVDGRWPFLFGRAIASDSLEQQRVLIDIVDSSNGRPYCPTPSGSCLLRAGPPGRAARPVQSSSLYPVRRLR